MAGRSLRPRNSDKDEEDKSETGPASSLQPKSTQPLTSQTKNEKEKALLRRPPNPFIPASSAGARSRPAKKPSISDAKVAHDDGDDDASSSELSEPPSSSAPSPTPLFPNLTTKKSGNAPDAAKSVPAKGEAVKPKAKAPVKEGSAKTQAHGAAKPKVKAPAKPKAPAQPQAAKSKVAAPRKQPAAPKSQPQAAKPTVKGKAPAKKLAAKTQPRAATSADKKGKGKGKAAQESETGQAEDDANGSDEQDELPHEPEQGEPPQQERRPRTLLPNSTMLTRNAGSQEPPASHCSTPPLCLAPLPSASTFPSISPPGSPSREHGHEHGKLAAGLLMHLSSDDDKHGLLPTPNLWSPSENNPRCPRCVQLIDGGMRREDVRCFGGPPCMECAGWGMGGEECRVGAHGLGDEGVGERAKKRVKVV